MSLFSYELSMTWIAVFYDLYDNVIFLNLHAPRHWMLAGGGPGQIHQAPAVTDPSRGGLAQPPAMALSRWRPDPVSEPLRREQGRPREWGSQRRIALAGGVVQRGRRADDSVAMHRVHPSFAPRLGDVWPL